MKIKQVNKDTGVEEEVEVMSPEEVDVKLAFEKTELEEKHKIELEVKDIALNTLSAEKLELEKKLDEVKPDHPNFKILKEALDKKDSDIKTLGTEVEKNKQDRVKEEVDSSIKSASKGDAELEKKIRLHLTTSLVGMKEDTKEARQSKIGAALKLSADVSGPGIFDGGTGGSGAGNGGGQGNESTVVFSANEKGLGAKLGISEADYKKYGNRVSKK